jgi:hypothetical protein
MLSANFLNWIVARIPTKINKFSVIELIKKTLMSFLCIKSEHNIKNLQMRNVMSTTKLVKQLLSHSNFYRYG